MVGAAAPELRLAARPAARGPVSRRGVPKAFCRFRCPSGRFWNAFIVNWGRPQRFRNGFPVKLGRSERSENALGTPPRSIGAGG
jgi:hypothetical protein